MPPTTFLRFFEINRQNHTFKTAYLSKFCRFYRYIGLKVRIEESVMTLCYKGFPEAEKSDSLTA